MDKTSITSKIATESFMRKKKKEKKERKKKKAADLLLPITKRPSLNYKIRIIANQLQIITRRHFRRLSITLPLVEDLFSAGRPPAGLVLGQT